MLPKPFREPPASYWPQTHDAVWDYEGTTCDADISVVPESVVRELIEAWDDAHVPMASGDLDDKEWRLYSAIRETRSVIEKGVKDDTPKEGHRSRTDESGSSVDSRSDRSGDARTARHSLEEDGKTDGNGVVRPSSMEILWRAKAELRPYDREEEE